MAALVMLAVASALSNFGEQTNRVVLASVEHDGELREIDGKPKVNPVSFHKETDAFATGPANATSDPEDLPFVVDWLKIKGIRQHLQGQQKTQQMSAAGNHKHVFLHIHKNAGTFLCELSKSLAAETLHPDAAGRNCNLDFDDYHTPPEVARAKTCEQRAGALSQVGATYTQIEQPAFPPNAQCPDTTYVVTLRDPVARICSHTRMTREHTGLPNDDAFSTMFTVGGAAYLKAQIQSKATAPSGWRQAWQFLDNYQVRVLAPAFDVPAGKIGEEHVRRAKATLSNMHVGVLEDYMGTAKTIQKAFGWPDFASSMSPQHTYASCVNNKFGTPEDLEELRQLNKYDSELVASFRGS